MKATIILLTYNGERFLPEVLDAAFSQKTTFDWDMIAVDSSSEDGTRAILERYPVRLEVIDKASFSHPGTRNAAVRMAGGNFVVFLTQDATPANENWLESLLKPYRRYPDVAATFSRQKMREGWWEPVEFGYYGKIGSPVREVRSVDWSQPLSVANYKANLDRFIIFSNSSASYLRKLLLQNPFDERLAMCEDQQWARRMLEQGHAVVYEPDSLVIHSHHYSARELYSRSLQGGRSLVLHRDKENLRRRYSAARFLCSTLYKVFFDLLLVIKSGLFMKNPAWFLVAPLHRIVYQWGHYRGYRQAIQKKVHGS